MNTLDKIKEKLIQALEPNELEVIDESHLHSGHIGSRPDGQTHYRVRIITSMFVGQSQVERHRTVYRVLSEELAGSVHALALMTHTPEEYSRIVTSSKTDL